MTEINALAVAPVQHWRPMDSNLGWAWLPSAYAVSAATSVLLAVIAFLLWRQQRQREFYVVQHIGYDLAFKEYSTVTYVTAERGPLIGGYSRSFSDFGAAKAFFEHIEEPSPRGHTTEEVHSVYVVRGVCRRPGRRSPRATWWCWTGANRAAVRPRPTCRS